MAIRLPLRTVGQFVAAASETGASSATGGISYPVTLPQDTDNIVVKFTASVVGAYSAVLQTTDDGGTTWYDVARTSIVSNANNNTAAWLSVPVNGAGVATGQTYPVAACIVSSGIRQTAASTLAGGQVSGLPILSQQARVFVVITGNITDAASNTYTAEVKVNSQSATA